MVRGGVNGVTGLLVVLGRLVLFPGVAVWLLVVVVSLLVIELVMVTV